MQILKAIVDTQRTNTTIGYVNTGDVVKLNLQVISNGEIGDNWVNPVIELHGIKSDKTCVRQTDNIQIVDLANHYLEITLHEQFMTCDGLVRLQLLIKDEAGRISSSVFYLRVTKSLEMDVMESHDYIQVFDDFDTYMELVKEFEAKMKEDVTLLEAEIQKVSDLSQSISKNEAERQKGETQRVTNENARQTAERNREVRMAELETKTSELIEKADEFINANTKRLLEEDARKDYMGNECRSIRETMNSNVDYAVKTAIGELNYLDYEGQQITANNSIEGHVKSAILKGNTLVNLQPKATREAWGMIINDTPPPKYCAYGGFDKVLPKLKPSTKYLIKFNKVIDDKFHSTHFSQGTPQTGDIIKDYRIVTTNDVITDDKTAIHIYNREEAFNTREEMRDFVLDLHVMIIEYQDGMENWDIPYFEGMTSVKMPVLSTFGDNLCDNNALKLNSNKTRLLTPLVRVKENTVLTISFSSKLQRNTLRYYDSKRNRLNDISSSFPTTPINIPNGVSYIEAEFYRKDGSSLEFTDEIVKTSDIMFSLANNKVYEPYKSNILTVNEPVELRGIGEVKDELNLVTGELTQRVGEVVFDGSETWGLEKVDTLTSRFFLKLDEYKSVTTDVIIPFMNDKIPFKGVYNIDDEGMFSQWAGFYLRITNEKLGTPSTVSLQTYLAQNPITMRYQLLKPTVKTVDLSDNVVYSYDEVTHYDCSSESGSLVPTLAVKVPTNVNAVISSQRATIQEQTEQINTLEKENALLTEQNEKQDVDIALNQDAINFMLFEVMGLSNDDANKLNPMAIYFANQILKGKLTYTQVIGKYPQFKDNIDSCLVAEGRSDLIVKID